MLQVYISSSVASSASGTGGVGSNDQVTNTTTETAFTQYYPFPQSGYPTGTPGGAYDDVANQFASAVRVTGHGYISTAASPGTLNLLARAGAKPNLVTGQLIGSTGAFTPPASLSNAYFSIDGTAIFRTSSPSQNNTQGRFEGRIFIQNASNVPFMAGIVNVGTGTAGFATAFALNQNGLAFQLSAQWGTASASNILTLSQLCFEQLTQE